MRVGRREIISSESNLGSRRTLASAGRRALMFTRNQTKILAVGRMDHTCPNVAERHETIRRSCGENIHLESPSSPLEQGPQIWKADKSRLVRGSGGMLRKVRA